ncbi:NifB/NifX family molybdenum-iron cluster-binding protein [Desulfurobacterium sp.]
MIIAIPVDKSGKNLLSSFGTSPAFLKIETVTGKREIIENIYACGGCSSGCTDGKNAADLLYENGVEGLLTREIAEAPFLKLLMKKIAVYRIPPQVKTIDKALKLFKEGKIKISYSHF